MTCSFLRLAMLKFETKLQKCVKMEMTIFKIFIGEGISSDIWLEITFNSVLQQCLSGAVKLNFQPCICYQYANHYVLLILILIFDVVTLYNITSYGLRLEETRLQGLQTQAQTSLCIHAD